MGKTFGIDIEQNKKIDEELDYENSNEDEIAVKTLTILNGRKIVIINRFPASKEALYNFACRLGKPMLKHSRSGDGLNDYIGNVKYCPDIQDDILMPTQGFSDIRIHTARAYNAVRPKYFAMLMIDPGWIDQTKGSNGESLLVRWKDIIDKYCSRYPETSDKDFLLLRTTKITYKPWYIKDEPEKGPLMFHLPNGEIKVRYWENMLQTIEGLGDQSENWIEFQKVLKRFDNVIHSCKRIIEYIMKPNQLVLVDNRFVGHGRKSFIGFRINEKGEKIYNTRQIFSIHIQ